MTRQATSKTYNLAVLVLYMAGVAVNIWFVLEMMKESDEGREKVETLKEKTLGRLKKWKKETLEQFHSQMVVIEAEEILRGNNG